MSKKTDFVNIALKEVGYKEGTNNNNKYGSYFKMNNVAWCALFVSWCARQAGIGTDVIPTYSGCGTGYNFFKNKGRIHNNPQVGDIVFFKPTIKGATSSHTGIVVEVTSTSVITVEGNASSKTDGVYKQTYKKGYSKFLGFGRPNFGDEPVIITYQSYDNKKKKWLPNVKVNTNDYAGNFNNAISAIYIDNLKYRVHDKVKGYWLPFVTGRKDYAGNLGHAIDGIQIENATYRVHIKNGSWLSWVSKVDNTANGYAGIYGKEIDAIQIKIG